ncbi:MAG: helix-turn-helix domain-containing protein [Pirellulales bacterium]|nr:helix-turn-helix domain-containing protein [Pirellulales bacterium]
MEAEFALVPLKLYRKRGINSTDAMIISIVNGYPRGDCYCSNNYFSKKLGVSESTIKKSISKLVKQKALFRELNFEDGKCVGRTLATIGKYRY